VLTGLDPVDTAHPRHVEQDGPADQPVLQDLDRARPCARRCHRPRRLPIEQATLERDVAKSVDVAVTVVVVVEPHVILGETH
jgi:hypothetical protein